MAYTGLLHEDRRQIHARVVRAIETVYRDRLGEQTEQLAHHALRAGLTEKAVFYLWQAGLRASAQFALRDARACPRT